MFLVVIKKVQGETPDIVLEMLMPVLENFIEIMSVEFPMRLIPRHEVDHTIELVSNAKSSAIAPY